MRYFLVIATICTSALVSAQDKMLYLTHIRQETNLCVPTSASMILSYLGKPHPPREIKNWSRNIDYDPTRPFNDFTATFFPDLISGLARHGVNWHTHLFLNDDIGFANGVQLMLIQISHDRPVMIDTTLYGGHTFVISGFRNNGQIFVAVDPNLPAPGIREISLDYLKEIWNSTNFASNIRAMIVTN